MKQFNLKNLIAALGVFLLGTSLLPTANVYADTDTSANQGPLIITEINVDTSNPYTSFIELMNYQAPDQPAHVIRFDRITLSYTLEGETDARTASFYFTLSNWRNSFFRLVPNQTFLCTGSSYTMCPGEYVLLHLPITSSFTINSISYSTETGHAVFVEHQTYQNYQLTVSTEDMLNQSITSSNFSYELDTDHFFATDRADVFRLAAAPTPNQSPLSTFTDSASLWQPGLPPQPEPALTTNFRPNNYNIATRYYGQPKLKSEESELVTQSTEEGASNSTENTTESTTTDPDPTPTPVLETPKIVPSETAASTPLTTTAAPYIPAVAAIDTANTVATTNSTENSAEVAVEEIVAETEKPTYQAPITGIIEAETSSKNLFIPILAGIVFFIFCFFFLLFWKRRKDEDRNQNLKNNRF